MEQPYVKKVYSDKGVHEQKDIVGIITIIVSSIISIILVILGILVFIL